MERGNRSAAGPVSAARRDVVPLQLPGLGPMCKHVAAVLYGVGARLDHKPELLFILRGVNHEELIAADAEKAVAAATSRGKSKRLAAADVGEVFGIELAADMVGGAGRRSRRREDHREDCRATPPCEGLR